MQMFDNVTQFVKDDLKKELSEGSKVSIAAACFSIYVNHMTWIPENT